MHIRLSAWRPGMALFTAALALILSPGWGRAWAQPIPPRPAGIVYIKDFGGLVEAPVRDQITRVAAALDKAAGAQVVVVTVNGLDGKPIEDYAIQLFRSWGIGDQKKNNGALFLVDKERLQSGQSGKVRIEVGYGLEGRIPDGKAGRILDRSVLPLWAEGQVSEGIKQGFLVLAAEVAAEYNLDLSQSADLAPLKGVQRVNSSGSLGKNLLYLFIVLIIILSITGGGPHRRRRAIWWGGGGGFGGFGGGGFGGGSSGGGGASR